MIGKQTEQRARTASVALHTVRTRDWGTKAAGKASLDLLARKEGLVMLSLMPDGKLVDLVRAIDPMSWQWRHRAGIVTLLHELADRLDPFEDTANAHADGERVSHDTVGRFVGKGE
jgi:hypothetical protein